MNQTVRLILIIAGVLLLAYGIYTLIIPEADINIGDLDILTVQDNSNAYITIGLGVAALVLAFLAGKKS